LPGLLEAGWRRYVFESTAADCLVDGRTLPERVLLFLRLVGAERGPALPAGKNACGGGQDALHHRVIRGDKGRQHLGQGAQTAPFVIGQHVDARRLLFQLLAGGADRHRDGSGHALGEFCQELGRKLQGHMAEGIRGPRLQAGDAPLPRACEVRLDFDADQHIPQALAAGIGQAKLLDDRDVILLEGIVDRGVVDEFKVKRFRHGEAPVRFDNKYCLRIGPNRARCPEDGRMRPLVEMGPCETLCSACSEK